MTQTKIEILRAGCGDCLFITIENDDEIFRILVDGGVSATYVDLKCGCPKCAASHGQQEIINYLKNINVEYVYQYFININ